MQSIRNPAVIFVIVVAYAAWFWPALTFPDGDAFYHIKMTQLLDQGFSRTFPWLPFTTLAEHYIDHHFLFHVFLYPFVHLLDPFIGAKLAGMLLAAGVLTIFYCLLRSLKFAAPGFFTLLLMLSPQFFFRLSLAKAPAFSLIFVLLGIFCLIKKKYWWLAVVAFFYVWAHGGWPLLPFITVIWVLSRSLLAPALHPTPYTLRPVLVAFRSHWPPLAAVFGGALAGLIINPYFPTNLYFLWVQFFKIGVINYQSKIGVGAEWYQASFGELFSSQAPLFAVLGLSIILLLVEAGRRARERSVVSTEPLLLSFGLMSIAAILFVLTIRSRRNVDYSLPFLTLAAASLFTIGRGALHQVYDACRSFLRPRYQWYLFPAIAILIFKAGWLGVNSTLLHRQILNRQYSPTDFTGATNWISQNVPAGEIVFHSDWDTFPMLFYGADNARYIVGLDTTFFYVRDPDRYELWRKIVWGEYVGDVTAAIRDSFNSRYVYVGKDRGHDLLELQLKLARGTEKVYEDVEGMIFKLPYDVRD